MRLRSLLAAPLMLALSFIACTGSDTTDGPPQSDPKDKAPATKKSEPFDIAMVTFAGYAPLYLAKDKGFFGDLEVRFHRIEEIPSIRAGVARGELEAYLATLDIAQDSDSKPPGKAVWAIDESNGGDGVIVGPGITDLKQLKGKKVAAEPGLPPNFVLLYLLHKNGMALSDVQFQDMTTQNAATAFISGAVDAAGIYEPFLSQAKSQRTGSSVVISSADTPGLIVDLIFASEATLAKRPEDVKTVIAGWRKAVDYIEKNPEEANSIMAKSFGLEVAEFTDIVGGITWLDLDDNNRLYGTSAAPGPVYSAFGEVNEVLKRNRASVYPSKAPDYLIRDFIPAN
jgi:NitT/TauT family transport system substrate-binding protein